MERGGRKEWGWSPLERNGCWSREAFTRWVVEAEGYGV
jgi:hypothetical protein